MKKKDTRREKKVWRIPRDEEAKEKWEEYREKLEMRMKTWREEIGPFTDIDDIWTQWKEIVTEVAKETIGEKTVKRQKKKKIYLNKEEKKKRKERQETWKKWREEKEAEKRENMDRVQTKTKRSDKNNKKKNERKRRKNI